MKITQKPLKPRHLVKGNLVDVISPAESPVFLQRYLRRGIKILTRDLGFELRFGHHALDSQYEYEAGSRENRLHDLHEAFADDSVKGIFCSMGGYSCLELLPNIDWQIIRKHPKVFAGSSDITVLLNAIYRKTGLITFHSSTIYDFGVQNKAALVFSEKHFSRIVMQHGAGKMPHLTNWKTLKPGLAVDILIGGNLDVLTNLLGTPFEPDWKDKILFLEDDGMTIEELNNLLWRLRVAGVFKVVRGLIIGKFTNIPPMDDDKTYELQKIKFLHPEDMLTEMLREATAPYKFPVLFGVDFGHHVASLTIPIGIKAKLLCPREGRPGTIELLETAVR